MCASSNKKRKIQFNRHLTSVKKKTEIKRAMNNRKQDKHIIIEGTSYEPGGY